MAVYRGIYARWQRRVLELLCRPQEAIKADGSLRQIGGNHEIPLLILLSIIMFPGNLREENIIVLQLRPTLLK